MDLPFALTVPYHKQWKDIHCGPACAQMVLDHAHIPIDTQPKLYNRFCNSNPNWHTNPRGLAKTLSDRSAHALDATHVDRGFTDRVSATHMIVWTIFHHNRPPIALIDSRNHWVVVTGCVLSGPPTSAYTVKTLTLQDPFDTSAKGGGGTGQIDVVTYEHWLADKFQNKVDVFGDAYEHRWVVVGAGDAPVVGAEDVPVVGAGVDSAVNLLELASSRAHAGSGNVPEINLQKPASTKVSGDPVDVDQAIEAAREGVRQDSVQAVEQVVVALNGADPRPGIAVPVARTGRQDQSVYIVPFYRDDRIPAAVLIDANTGAFLGVRAIPGGSLGYVDTPALLRRDALREQFQDGILDPDTGERRSLDNATISDTPVWEPSVQSPSPYYPFWRIQYDGDQPYNLYVRLDGQVFTELTPAYG